MSRWEYRKLDLNGPLRREEDIDLLNTVGEQGWELVGVAINGLAYLKRVVAEPPQTLASGRRAASSRTNADRG
jgi:hypothetical protein